MLDEVMLFWDNSYQNKDFEELSTKIENKIKDILESSGLMFRMFGRVKSKDSICKKLNKKYNKYISTNGKMQDSIGIRITLYFKDDIDICIRLLKDVFDEDNHECDLIDTETFKPLRVNYVFRIPEEIGEMRSDYIDQGMVDNTFEVQFRTIFTEGWQEVEHDIRYKYKEDWEDEIEMSRDLNAVSAVLELCDSNIIGIFDNLAYKKYKAKKLESMIRSRFRIRLDSAGLDSRLNTAVLEDYNHIGKCIFRFDREKLIRIFGKSRLDRTIDNVIYIVNCLEAKNHKISELDHNTTGCFLEQLVSDYEVGGNEPYNSIVAMKF